MKKILLILGIVFLSLISCNKDTARTQETYYEKCTSYEMTVNNSIVIYAVSYKFIGNDKYEVVTFKINNDNIVTGTTTTVYNVSLFTKISINSHCYKSLIP